jgi:nucleoside-diphosphate-sugar epimerase
MKLVTGGAGYLGQAIVDALVARGDEVRILDLNAPDDTNAVDFIRGDIRDPDAVRRAVQGVDAVFHNVATVPLAKDKEEFVSVNVGGTRTLLTACRDAGVRKVVNTSSSAVYGVPSRNPVDLQVAPSPGEAYGQAKWDAEKVCQSFAGDLDVSIVRPRTIIGHGRLGIMQIVFEWIRQGRNVPVLGGGHNLYQFVHADDCVSACIAASEAPPVIALAGAEDFCSMRATLEGLIAHAETRSRVVSLPMGPAVLGMKVTSKLGLSPLGAYHALMYGREMYFDISSTKEALNWAPTWSNVAMFAQAYDWYLENREEVLHGAHRSHHRSPVRQGAVLDALSRALTLVPGR